MMMMMMMLMKAIWESFLASGNASLLHKSLRAQQVEAQEREDGTLDTIQAKRGLEHL